jgi:hypothetical protein
MVKFIVLLSLLFSTSVYAAIQKETIKSGIELKPGQHELITIESTEDLEIGWITTQEKRCTMHCVEATDKSGGYESKISTDIGASLKYKPANGKIIVDYANVADHPVTIDIYKSTSTCEAQACAFLKNDQSQRGLVFKIAEFKSIENSADGSYSVISGLTTTGQEFTVKAVWWTTDTNAMRFSCDKTIKGYLDKHTSPDDYQPYILSGRASGYNDTMVLESVDTCVPKAPNFGVSEEMVYKGPVKFSEEKFNPKDFSSSAEFETQGRKINTQSALVKLTVDKFWNSNVLEIRFFKDMLTEDGKFTVLNDPHASYDALMALFLDKDNKIIQANLTCVIPGFTAAYTVASSEKELQEFFSQYSYDGKQLKLLSKGSHVDKGVNVLSWDMNLDVPVFDKTKTSQ